MPETSSTVWNARIDSHSYRQDQSLYRAAILEQYKIYVEMADRTSQRRGLTNTFFLTLNVALVATITRLAPEMHIDVAWLILPLAALLTQCAGWLLLVRSYRVLNSSKYRVINQMEELLPAKPWETEWNIISARTGIARYWRLTLIEQWTPVIFAAIYISGYCSYAFR